MKEVADLRQQHPMFRIRKFTAADEVGRIAGKLLRKDPEEHYLINPGSVGFPKDGDYRASYALMELGEGLQVSIRRVAYDVPAVQARMRKAGLPERHIVRLEVGW